MLCGCRGGGGRWPIRFLKANKVKRCFTKLDCYAPCWAIFNNLVISNNVCVGFKLWWDVFFNICYSGYEQHVWVVITCK